MIKRLLLVLTMALVSLFNYAQIRVAILPTTDKSGEVKYALKLLLNSSLTTAISTTEGYEAYDRIDLSSVLDEQSFQRTGMVSDAEIHKIGEMTGASFVLITEAAPMDESHLVATAKIVNVESAKIENSAGSIVSTDPSQMETDCKALTDKLFIKTPVTNNPYNVQSTNKNGIENGHEYVDLGLSVKWATCNVGASRPEDYGDYYAWGNTVKERIYSDSGISFLAIDLSKTDDVAFVKWGGNWRMPTKYEINELCEKCVWTWTMQNGVSGYKVSNALNSDNYIFLPSAGYIKGGRLYYKGECGNYWSRSLNKENLTEAYFLGFLGEDAERGLNSRGRGNGFSVRPVCPIGDSLSRSNQEYGRGF